MKDFDSAAAARHECKCAHNEEERKKALEEAMKNLHPAQKILVENGERLAACESPRDAIALMRQLMEDNGFVATGEEFALTNLTLYWTLKDENFEEVSFLVTKCPAGKDSLTPNDILDHAAVVFEEKHGYPLPCGAFVHISFGAGHLPSPAFKVKDGWRYVRGFSAIQRFEPTS